MLVLKIVAGLVALIVVALPLLAALSGIVTAVRQARKKSGR
jgi:hypothetical protein